MNRPIFLASAFVGVYSLLSAPARAASSDECAIWLCMPDGFKSSECSGPHRAFTKRIRKGKPPLPDLQSCSSGGNGKYQTGYQRLENCQQGYTEKANWFGNNRHLKDACVSESCMQRYDMNAPKCEFYQRRPRTEPHFVDMWVDDGYLGRFWW